MLSRAVFAKLFKQNCLSREELLAGCDCATVLSDGLFVEGGIVVKLQDSCLVAAGCLTNQAGMVLKASKRVVDAIIKIERL